MKSIRLTHALAIAAQIHKVTLAYFLFLSLMFSTLAGQMQQNGPQLRAATCSLPTTIDSTIEITPTNEDNIVDCSAQDITITSTGKLILKSSISANADVADDKGVQLKVGNLTIENGGEITASGQGYTVGSTDASSGTLASATASTGTAAGSGGGHGGAGGAGNTSGGVGVVLGSTGGSYGLLESPITLGGAGADGGMGGAGGAGGGAIRIESSGTVTINGEISANGLLGAKSGDGVTSGGGGAGGSIWIQANVLAGNGTVSARGGSADATATYVGGGGGGGRVVMICNTTLSYSGSVFIDKGLGAQNGQDGFKIGPGCAPAAPTVLRFYETANTTSFVNRRLDIDYLTTSQKITFASNIQGENERLQIEVRKKTDAFQNIPTGGQVTLASNKSCNDIPDQSGVQISQYCGYAEVTGLTVSEQYKWQARIVNASGVYSPWVQYGGNSVNDSDFTVSGPMASLIIVEGNGISGAAGQPLNPAPRVRAVDAAGYGVPFVPDFNWTVTSGGGLVTNKQHTTDQWGELTATWTLGSTAGINNNTMNVWRYATGYSVTFTVSTVPDQIVSYQVVPSSSLVLVDANFSLTVTAKDKYGNTVPHNGSVTLYPVSSYDQVSPGLGTLAPETITLTNGVGTTNTATYSYTENIQIRVSDGNGITGVSPSIMFVAQLGTCPGIIIDQATTWNASSVPGGVFDCRGLGQLTVRTGATLTLQGYDNGDGDWSNDYGVTILADDMLVESGAVVSADATGYAVGRGPGWGNCAGASYGGYGGNGPYNAAKTPYGSIYGSVLLGSGASERGSGGGAIKLTLSGTLTVEGAISANAYSGALGCWNSTASGGSVWVEATTIASTTGTGIIRANSEIGRGSGGRVALYYANNNGFAIDSLHLQSYGGNQNDSYGQGGGAGTVYVEQLGVDLSQQGTLLIDSRSSGNPREAYVPAGNYIFKKIIATRKGHVLFKGDATTGSLQLSSKEGIQGDSTLSQVNVEGTLKYIPENPGETLEVEGVELGLKGDVVGINDISIGATQTSAVTLYANTWAHNDTTPWEFGNITVASNGLLVMQGYDNGDSNWSNDYGVALSVDNLTVATGGYIDAVARGYGYARGYGAAWCGGASYGGYGGNGPNNAGGVPYGTIYGSLALGSGSDNESGSGPGGGAMKLTVANELKVDGIIDASAHPTRSGCWGSSGSGGSIWIDTNKLSSTTGTPVIRANGGGYAASTGRGSGGRIAIYYSALEGLAINENTVLAIGGRYQNGNYGKGGSAGTIYYEQKGVDTPQQGKLLIANANHATASISGAYVPVGDYVLSEIKAVNGGHVTFAGNSSAGKLTVTNGNSLVGSTGNVASITINGVFEYSPVESGVALGVNGVNVALAGDAQGVSAIKIGESSAAGVTLYANTWAHNDTLPWQFGDITVAANGSLYMQGYDNGDTNWTNDYGVSLSVNNLTVATGGKIDAISRGYAAGRGTGAASCGGASYGGYGGSSPGGVGGVPYGTIYGSLFLGSGADTGETSNGLGGGAMKLTVANELRVDGIIDASADPTRYGCWYSSPSGGSIWIDTNKLSSTTGTPVIRANGGGYAASTGRGSGGRIAIYYSTLEGLALNENTVNAYGGRYQNANYGYGGSAGTIYYEQKGTDSPQQGTLLVYNGNHASAPTTGAYLPADTYTLKSILLRGKGNVTVDGNQTVGVLEVDENTVNVDTNPARVTVKGILRNIGGQPFNIKNNGHYAIEGKIENIDSITVGKTSAGYLTLNARTWNYSYDTPYEFALLDIGSTGVVYVRSYDNGDSDWSNDHGLALSTMNFNVDAGGMMTATGNGYSGYRGPGAAVEAGGNHSGASHGGLGNPGGNGVRNPYGSMYEPTTLGSGGYRVSPGGGAIKISVAGTSTINGTIETSGVYTGVEANGGTGGSIWLETDELTGAGKLTANGATSTNWDGGGSAGGRIAVYYRNNDGFDLSKNSLQARGGPGGRGNGGPGTVYVENLGVDERYSGRLIVDNNGVNGQYAGVVEGTYKLKGIELSRYGNVRFLGNAGILEITSPSGFSGDATKPLLTVQGTLKYTGAGTFSIDGVNVEIAGKLEGIEGAPVTAITVGQTSSAGLTLNANTWYHNKNNGYQIDTLTVGPLGTVTMNSYDDGDSVWTDDYGVTLQTNDLTIETGGLITASGKGYGGYRGPGAAIEAGGYHGGASYGGYGYSGGNGVRASYGNLYEPVDLGSGGYTVSPGGGAMRLIVNNALRLDGNIESLGVYTGGVNSGTGGSIWVETNQLSGSGKILANAYNGSNWDGGGSAGGRIALYYRTNDGFDLSTTSLQARGGTGSRGNGGPGTVYFENRGVDAERGGSLIVDNNNVAARAGDFDAGDYTFNDVTIGQNVSAWVKSDTKAVVENSTMPAAHAPVKIDESVALLHFDEQGFVDSSINANNAMQFGGVTAVSGKFGRGQSILQNQVIKIEPITLPDSYTLELWAKFPLPTTIDGWRTAVGRIEGGLHPIIVENTGRLGLYTNAFYATSFNVNTLTPGWHHIATRSTGSTTEFFVDGVSVGSVASRPTGAISYLGNYCNTAGCRQNFGQLDAVRLTSGLLTNEQILASATSETAPTATTNTVALWQLDETELSYADSSLSQSNRAFGLGEKSVTGVYGNALQFNGYNSQVVSGVSMATPVDYSLELRFKTNTTVGGKLIGFSDSSTTATNYNDRTLYLSNDGRINFGMYNNGNRVITSANSYNDNEWHYVIATFSTVNGMRLYVDGQLVASDANTSYYPYTAFVRVGYDNLNGWANAPTSHYFAGIIDEVRVLSREISAIEVTNLNNTASQLSADAETLILWHFDDEKVNYFSDEVSLNGAPYAQEVVTKTGVYGQSAYFSGNRSYVSLPNGPMDFLTGFSVSFWARPTSSPNYARFFDFNNGTPSNNVLLSRYGTGSDLWFEIYNGSSSAGGIRVTNGIINNEWHHYAVTVSATGYASIYRDGNLLQSSQLIAIPNVVRANKFIGRSPWNDDPYYAGYLDEFSLKNRAMTPDEIKAEYNGYTLAEFTNEYLTQVIGKGVTLNVKGNFLLDSGASIIGTGQGFPTDEGQGRGNRGVGYSGGGGGANGGNGGQGQGDGVNQPAQGGVKYGEQLVPKTLGAGGGASSQGAMGGNGGGAFAIIASGLLQDGVYTKGDVTVRGSIIMDGSIGRTGSPGGGGGAGGSILLHGNTCDISGTLSARGGEGGNSDVDGGSGGGGRVSILYNSGPCYVNAIVSVAEGTPSDPANYGAQVGQTGTYPDEPNSVPWPSQYREQFELKPAAQSSISDEKIVYAMAATKVADVLGVTESAIPVGGVINGTTVTLKADAYDAGATIASPKRLKIQVELKKIDQLFDGQTGIHDSDSVIFTGGPPVVLSVQVANLEMGASYKWRVRTVNIDNNLESEWRDYGDNAGNAADFTITTVAALDMQSPNTTLEFSDSATVTVAALNSVGSVDTTYRGTVRFRSDSLSAQLPDEYTFTSGDNGQRTFTNAIRFFESGTFTVTVEDAVNSTLIDSLVFTVNPPRIPYLSIGATSTEIIQGQTTTLQWQSNYISNLSINNSIGSVGTTGSIEVSPLETTTYVITGTNEADETVTSSVTIFVEEVQPTISITAVPNPVINGNSVTLSWSSEYLSNLSIDNGIGAVGAAGSLVIFPDSTTTYEISGTSPLNETFRTSVTVTVNNLVGTVSLQASATELIVGNATTLQWSSENLTNLSINNGVGAVSASGTREVSPSATTTYVISGQNIQTGETVNASVTITVLPVPTVATLTLTASATQINPGNSVVLQWQSTQLSNLSISQNIGSVDANGTRTVTPGATTTYTITGQKGDGSTMQASVTITVIPVVVAKTPSLGISASASKIKVGESVTLQWQSSNVTDLSINPAIGAVGASGTLQVSPKVTTTYEISAKTGSGKIIKATVTVQVQQVVVTTIVPTGSPISAEICPVIKDFIISTKMVKKGENFTITWNVQQADTVAINAFAENLPLSGSATISLQSSKDITLYARKGSCEKLQTKHLDVVAAYPWEGAGGMLIGVVALETIAMQIGVAHGNIWMAIAGLIDRRKKRTPWGVVYNAVSKKMVGRAIVRLWDAKSGRLVDTVVTDAQGIFKLTPKKGQYVIKVVHPEFTYPSKLVASSDTDSGFSNIYKGEVIEIKEDNELLTISIPLDPVKRSKGELFTKYATNFTSEVISLISPIVLVAGLVYSVVVSYLYPVTVNYVIIGIYAILLVLKLAVYLSKPKIYGTVNGVDGKIVSGLEIGLFEKEFDTMVAKTFTNKRGGYNFVVKNGDYYLRILDPGYKILSKFAGKKGLVINKLPSFSGGVRLIAENLMVYPVK